jgi:rubrerythrin
MDTSKPVEILKTAILMEKRGKAFYELMAEQTKSAEAKKIFSIMAEEESAHIEFLSKQFKSYMLESKFLKPDTSENIQDDVSNQVITGKLRNQISAAGFEAAAISAAMDFETRAVEVYSQRAAETSDPVEKDVYEWLAEWERGHHKLLNQLNEDLKESIWFDNHFWPF